MNPAKALFQLMSGAQWLELLCRHIPDCFEHLVRYVGWYSNRVRAQRAAAVAVERVIPDRDGIATCARESWARLIKKLYEVDPLECPKCKGPMRVIGLITMLALCSVPRRIAIRFAIR